jgi:hypothetical protein
MDYVYICRSGDNEELRYSIRSVVKNMPQGNIWLIGNKPDWYIGNFIPVDDIGGKFTNITNAISIAANSDQISDDFVLMHDDFFAIKPVKNIPIMHNGLLLDKIKEYQELDPGSRYAAILSKAYAYLRRRGIRNPLDYDIHVPMIMNKNNLKNVVNKTNAPMSVYGNIFNIGGEQVTDVKIYTKFNKLHDRSHDVINSDFPFVSCEDKSFAHLHRSILREMLPNKTIYER